MLLVVHKTFLVQHTSNYVTRTKTKNFSFGRNFSRGRRSLGALRRGLWGPGEVDIEFFFKIIDGLEQTLPTMTHLLYSASYEKNRF